jgi:hypothetical protein
MKNTFPYTLGLLRILSIKPTLLLPVIGLLNNIVLKDFKGSCHNLI